jgi:chromosome segregation ATPase
MATKPEEGQLRVVPDLEKQQEIEEKLDAPQKLSKAIEDLNKQRADAKAQLTRTLAKHLAVEPPNLYAMEQARAAWKAQDEALEKEIADAEALLPIVKEDREKCIRDQPDVAKDVLQRRVEQLEKEADEAKDEQARLQETLTGLENQIRELKRQHAAINGKDDVSDQPGPAGLA